MPTRILDFADYPEISTHGVADVTIVGGKAWIRMFRWRRFEGVFRPMIVLAVGRPAEGLYAPLPHTLDLEAQPQVVIDGGTTMSFR
jgi:hypothetical protein